MSVATIARAPGDADRLGRFVDGVGVLLESQADEATVLRDGATLLANLVRQDDWLPDAYAAADRRRYQQHLLHRDPRARFSVVSFVWGPGQATPIHDHTVWGLIGMLRGDELAEPFAIDGDGELVATGPPRLLRTGEVEALSPRIGDIHRVANAHDDRVSISIHVYGADIGAVERSTFDANGIRKRFVSGYTPLPALIP